MPQTDISNDAGFVELKIIDGVEVLFITGKDFIKVSCDPDLPSTIVAGEIDGKKGLLTNGVSTDGGLLIKGKAVALKAPVIYLDSDVYFSEQLPTKAQDLIGALNELYDLIINKRRKH